MLNSFFDKSTVATATPETMLKPYFQPFDFISSNNGVMEGWCSRIVFSETFGCPSSNFTVKRLPSTATYPSAMLIYHCNRAGLIPRALARDYNSKTRLHDEEPQILRTLVRR